MSRIRCIVCDVLVEDSTGLTRCPSCGTKSKPVAPELDLTVKLNLQELRILCTWAEFHVQSMKEESEQAQASQTLSAIGGRLRPQLPSGSILFLSDELKELKEKFGTVQTNFPDVIDRKEDPSP